MAELTVAGMMASFITILVGVVLIPVIYNQVEAANITDTALSSVITLIPLLFGLGIVVSVMKGLI